MKFNKNRLTFICGIIFSVVCTWLFVRRIEWSALKSAFQNANCIYIIPAVIFIVLLFVVQTVRWKIIVSPLKRITFMPLFSATFIGYMANYFMPARMGELIRPLIISKKEGVKVTSMLATVALERTVDLLGLIIFTIVTLILLPAPHDNRQTDISVIQTMDSVSQLDSGTDTDNNKFLFWEVKEKQHGYSFIQWQFM